MLLKERGWWWWWWRWGVRDREGTESGDRAQAEMQGEGASRGV